MEVGPAALVHLRGLGASNKHAGGWGSLRRAVLYPATLNTLQP